MKKISWSLLLVVIALAVFAVPALAQGNEPVPTALTEIQMFVIATVASAFVWTLRLAKVELSAGWLTTAVYVISIALAYLFIPLIIPAFPPFGDAVSFVQAFVTWVGAVLLVFSPFAGFATLIYNTLLKMVLERYVRPLFAK